MMNKITNYLAVCLSAVFLAGCSSISLSDLATGGGAVAGAAIGTLTGNPAVVIATTSGGAIAGSTIISDSVDTAEACANNPEVCKTVATANVISDFIHWIIGGGVMLIIVAWVLPGPQNLLFWRRRGKDQE